MDVVMLADNQILVKEQIMKMLSHCRGGRRLMAFPLCSCHFFNTGSRRIFMFSPNSSQSVIDHLPAGRHLCGFLGMVSSKQCPLRCARERKLLVYEDVIVVVQRGDLTDREPRVSWRRAGPAVFDGVMREHEHRGLPNQLHHPWGNAARRSAAAAGLRIQPAYRR